jgi:uncharacterized protein YqjF (DUF2071 family)
LSNRRQDEHVSDVLTAPFRQVGALRERDHRPWSVPRRPWLIGQTWRSLLFAHWRLDPASLAPLVPPPLELDTYEGEAWVGVTPFILTGFRLALTPPLPYLSTFPEVNVRTYVSVGAKPGIYFFSLDAASRLAVEGARRLYRLPYFLAEMEADEIAGRVRYRSARSDERGSEARLEMRYEAKGGSAPAEPGSLAHFLTERYCLYTLDEDRNPLRAEIHHPPWQLCPAKAEISENSMAPQALRLPGEDPLLHYSEMQDVLIWRPQRA